MRLLPAFLLVLLVAACLAPGGGAADRNEVSEGEPLLEFSGTVVHVPLEGGFFGILGEDGRQYDPLHLPEDLRQDGLKVRVQAREVPEAIGFHMWGTRIEILRIEKE